jgi:hypothetical protein
VVEDDVHKIPAEQVFRCVPVIFSTAQQEWFHIMAAAALCFFTRRGFWQCSQNRGSTPQHQRPGPSDASNLMVPTRQWRTESVQLKRKTNSNNHASIAIAGVWGCRHAPRAAVRAQATYKLIPSEHSKMHFFPLNDSSFFVEPYLHVRPVSTTIDAERCVHQRYTCSCFSYGIVLE